MSNTYGETEPLQISAKNTQSNFDKRNYIKDYIVHETSTLSEEEAADYFGESVAEKAIEYELVKYSIVVADIDMVWSEEALNMGPQIDTGRYSRAFLCGTMKSDKSWKIYEIYWGEYYGL